VCVCVFVRRVESIVAAKAEKALERDTEDT